MSEKSNAVAIPTAAQIMNYNATPETVPEKAGGGIPYIGHYGAKTNRETSARLDAAGIELYEFYLNDGLEPLKVKPFSMHLLSLGRFYTKQDQEQNLTAVKLKSDDATFKDGFREHLYVLAAVRLGGGVYVPAVGTFRGGLADAFRKADELVKIAGNDKAWSVRSPAHAASVIPGGKQHPGARVILNIWADSEKTQDGKNDFNMGYGSTRPTPSDEAVLFQQWFESQMPSIQRVAGIFAQRVEEARKLV